MQQRRVTMSELRGFCVQEEKEAVSKVAVQRAEHREKAKKTEKLAKMRERRDRSKMLMRVARKEAQVRQLYLYYDLYYDLYC